MGMYTELIFGAAVRIKDKQTLDILEYLFGKMQEKPASLPDHPFFKCPRWDMITCCSSFYFAVRNTHRSICRDDDDSESFLLSSRANLKNYDNEIEKFIDWIKPYIEQGSGAREFFAIVTYEDGEPVIYNLREIE